MPHQCLKCGKVFPSGSMEILKGCSNCKGKRFFYTEKAISDEERQKLTDRANKDIKELVKEILTQKRSSAFESEISGGPDSGWVRVDKDHTIQAVDEESMRKIKGTATDRDSRVLVRDKLGHIGEPSEIKSKLQDILDEEFGEKARIDGITQLESRPEPEVKKEKKKKPKRPSKKKPVREVRRKILKKPPSEKKPEVITIVEPGVYEIDLEQLMDKSPIIILKDGTYLLHLPSLFKQPEGKKSESDEKIPL